MSQGFEPLAVEWVGTRCAIANSECQVLSFKLQRPTSEGVGNMTPALPCSKGAIAFIMNIFPLERTNPRNHLEKGDYKR